MTDTNPERPQPPFDVNPATATCEHENPEGRAFVQDQVRDGLDALEGSQIPNREHIQPLVGVLACRPCRWLEPPNTCIAKEVTITEVYARNARAKLDWLTKAPIWLALARLYGSNMTVEEALDTSQMSGQQLAQLRLTREFSIDDSLCGIASEPAGPFKNTLPDELRSLREVQNAETDLVVFDDNRTASFKVTNLAKYNGFKGERIRDKQARAILYRFTELMRRVDGAGRPMLFNPANHSRPAIPFTGGSIITIGFNGACLSVVNLDREWNEGPYNLAIVGSFKDTDNERQKFSKQTGMDDLPTMRR